MRSILSLLNFAEFSLSVCKKFRYLKVSAKSRGGHFALFNLIQIGVNFNFLKNFKLNKSKTNE
jgi:hypothetical protein